MHRLWCWESLRDLGAARQLGSLCSRRCVGNPWLSSELKGYIAGVGLGLQSVLGDSGLPELAASRILEFYGTEDTRYPPPELDKVFDIYSVDRFEEID